MNPIYLVSGVITFGLFIYLLVVLLRGEELL